MMVILIMLFIMVKKYEFSQIQSLSQSHFTSTQLKSVLYHMQDFQDTKKWAWTFKKSITAFGNFSMSIQLSDLRWSVSQSKQILQLSSLTAQQAQILLAISSIIEMILEWNLKSMFTTTQLKIRVKTLLLKTKELFQQVFQLSSVAMKTSGVFQQLQILHSIMNLMKQFKHSKACFKALKIKFLNEVIMLFEVLLELLESWIKIRMEL